jgi:hypothetical protein
MPLSQMSVTLPTIHSFPVAGHVNVNNDILRGKGSESNKSLFTHQHQWSQKQKQTPWPLVRERTIPTNRPPLVDEI